MPNYVHNILKIRSKKDNPEDIINFIKQHYNKEGLFDFNTFTREPESEEECPPQYNFNTPTGYRPDRNLENPEGQEWFNWYDWRLEYWGTKWNCGEESKCYYDFNMIREHYSYFSPIYLHFTTAWYPPIPIFEKIITMHPELRIEITYHSTENEEYGVFERYNDEITHEHWTLKNYQEKKKCNRI